MRRSHQEIVWLNDIPVATIRTNDQGTGTGVFYVHTDHLNAPTKITRPTNNEVVWRWDHDPFGNGTPNEDPDGNGLIVSMNLRFPGQYLDQETGLYYNYFRYYDPQSGRYVQADPIGLAGGQWNTFGYVGNDPINSIDPWGLDRHHIFPQSGWPNYSDAAKDVFDDSILETAGRHRWSKAHMDYNTATKELAKNFCEENGIDPSKMTSQQARSLVDEITQSSDPRIRQFLEREVGPPQPDIEPSTTPPTPPGMSILGRILFTLSLLGHSDEAR